MKRIFLFILGFILLTGLVGGGYFVFFDSEYKAQYYVKKATKLVGEDVNEQELSQATQLYLKAAEIFERLGHKQHAVESYIQLGLLHLHLGNVLQIERMVLKALAIGESDISPDLQTRLYLLLASTSAPDKARDYIAKALDIAHAMQFKPEMIKAYYLQGKAHEYKAQFEQAEASYLKAITIIKNHPTTRRFVDVTRIYESLGELYFGGGAFDQAITYYDKALDNSMHHANSDVTVHYMRQLAAIYKEKNELETSCAYIRQAIDEYALTRNGEALSQEYIALPDYCRDFNL